MLNTLDVAQMNLSPQQGNCGDTTGDYMETPNPTPLAILDQDQHRRKRFVLKTLSRGLITTKTRQNTKTHENILIEDSLKFTGVIVPSGCEYQRYRTLL